jgi:AbrB family looped-hinge helix DNA binding protein
MKITSKGQVTIPIAMREKLGLLPQTEVEFEIDGNAVRIFKTRKKMGETRGQEIVRHLCGSATVKMTTDEIMALTRGED